MEFKMVCLKLLAVDLARILGVAGGGIEQCGEAWSGPRIGATSPHLGRARDGVKRDNGRAMIGSVREHHGLP